MLQISTNEEIIIDTKSTGYLVRQEARGTIVWSRKTGEQNNQGLKMNQDQIKSMTNNLRILGVSQEQIDECERHLESVEVIGYHRKTQPIVDRIPAGWTIDKYAGTSLPGYVYIHNGRALSLRMAAPNAK